MSFSYKSAGISSMSSELDYKFHLSPPQPSCISLGASPFLGKQTSSKFNIRQVSDLEHLSTS